MERQHFETELLALRNQLLTMGGLVEERVHRAVQALIHRKEEEAKRIIATDKEINDLHQTFIRPLHFSQQIFFFL